MKMQTGWRPSRRGRERDTRMRLARTGEGHPGGGPGGLARGWRVGEEVARASGVTLEQRPIACGRNFNRGKTICPAPGGRHAPDTPETR